MRQLFLAACIAALAIPATPALADQQHPPSHQNKPSAQQKSPGQAKPSNRPSRPSASRPPQGPSRPSASRPPQGPSRPSASRPPAGRPNAAIYDRRGRYATPRPLGRKDYMWRGRDGKYYCRRSNGTTGLVIGAALGGLAGYQLDQGQNRTLGTIIGTGTGALLGRTIDRGELKCH